MGIADLIPGISGGTVAFLFGIYDDLVEGLKSLKFSTLKEVHWSFLLPLGGGIATSLLIFSKLMAYFLTSHQITLFAFLFGVVSAASVKSYSSLEKKSPLWMLLGVAIAFFLCGISTLSLVELSPLWLIAAGAIAAMAMLLPGLSGSYLLHLFGVYPLIIFALSTPFQKNALITLSLTGLGVTCGVFCFSRLIVVLLQRFRVQMLSLLIGLMAGGLRSIWPFSADHLGSTIAIAFSGFILFNLIELKSIKAVV
ncbi:MAG: hypothetical protein S4CHLAM45_14300 [Chlamydiales bacterium]|nr:hypothetical protein [Chlamydiales bacterium]MCH9620061.1 hypothetical protein [Chlamydiales bacterium]MCH9623520.1 hypothetical protein [Chlamydiales bacterium]